MLNRFVLTQADQVHILVTGETWSRQDTLADRWPFHGRLIFSNASQRMTQLIIFQIVESGAGGLLSGLTQFLLLKMVLIILPSHYRGTVQQNPTVGRRVSMVIKTHLHTMRC